MDSSEIWDNRFTALATQMGNLKQATSPEINNTVSTVSRINTIHALAANLQVFVTAQYRYFDEKRYEDQGQQESPSYSPNYTRRSVLNQSLEDIKLIKRIFQQRQDNSLIKHLELFDRIAMEALRPAIDIAKDGEVIEKRLLSYKTTALCYFGKAASIRIIPYAEIAIIGIPYTALTTSIDWLAIVHEAGHYVYRRGRIRDDTGSETTLRRAIIKLITKKPAYQYDWIDEIFADYYGTLLAGPPMALDFQDLALEFSVRRFSMNDGEHPSPKIRPYLYNKALNLYQPEEGSTDPWAEFLQGLWDVRRRYFELHLPFKWDSFGSNGQEVSKSISNGVKLGDKKLDKAIEACRNVTINLHTWMSESREGKINWWHQQYATINEPTEEQKDLLNELKAPLNQFENALNEQMSARKQAYKEETGKTDYPLETFEQEILLNEKASFTALGSEENKNILGDLASSINNELYKEYLQLTSAKMDQVFEEITGYLEPLDLHEVENKQTIEKIPTVKNDPTEEELENFNTAFNALIDKVLEDEWPKYFIIPIEEPDDEFKRIMGMDLDTTDPDWVFNVLFAAGWNTFGNGQWTAGP